MKTPTLIQSPLNPEWLIPRGWEQILGFQVDYRLGEAVLKLWRVQWNQHAHAPAPSPGPLHSHPHHQLLYYRQGAGRLLLANGAPHDVRKGSIFFIPAGCLHGFLDGGGEPPLCLALDFTLAHTGLAPLAAPTDAPESQEAVLLSLLHTEKARPFELRPVDQAAVDGIIAAIVEENDKRELGFAAMVQAHLLRLMSLCLRATQRAQGFGEHFRHTAWRHAVTARRVEALIAERATAPDGFALGEAARLCGTSVNQLNRILKRQTGHTFHQLLLHRRLCHAAALLRGGEANCTEAAFAAGFNDSNYFSRAFRKVFGHTPSELGKVRQG